MSYVEVCDTSEQDRTLKLAGYAAAGIPVYWVLDLGLRQLEVYACPVAGAYTTSIVLADSDTADVILDGQVVGRIAIADLLPPESRP